MYKRNSLYRVRMRKKRRVLRGISMGAKFMLVLVGLVKGADRVVREMFGM